MREWWGKWLHIISLKGNTAEQRVFQGVRRRLAVSYALVLATLLVISGFVLYNGTTRTLTNQTQARLTQTARSFAHRWQMDGAPPPVDGPTTHPNNDVPYIAYYATNGKLLGADPRAKTLPAFTANNLISATFARGTAGDVTSNNIQRYAMTVRNSQGQVLGVVQIGFSVSGEVR